MMAEWISAAVAFLALVGTIAIGLYNRGRQEQSATELGAELRKDVNGLGRNQRREIAYLLRACAFEDPIRKEKLLALADLIEPK